MILQMCFFICKLTNDFSPFKGKNCLFIFYSILNIRMDSSQAGWGLVWMTQTWVEIISACQVWLTIDASTRAHLASVFFPSSPTIFLFL